MLKTKIKSVEVEILEDVICDACEESCHNGINLEYMSMTNHWGYGSKKDGEVWEAHICEGCIDTLFPFINFKKGNYMSNTTNNQEVVTKIRLKESIIIQE